MKLGTETGSLINHLKSRTVGNPEPTVGLGVTFLCWTDRHPGTVIEVWTDKKGVKWFHAQEDSYERLDKGGPYTEVQKYEYTANPLGYVYTYKNVNGKWQNMRFKADTNRWVKGDRNVFVGKREEYRDPCF